MTVVLRPTRAYEQRDQLVTLGHASVEWVMGCYLTPDSVAAMAHFSAQNG